LSHYCEGRGDREIEWKSPEPKTLDKTLAKSPMHFDDAWGFSFGGAIG